MENLGAAGSTPNQRKSNNLVLKRELDKLKIKSKKNFTYLEELCGVKEMVLEIKHPKTGDIIYVGNDRWGYVVDNAPDDFEGTGETLDQCDLEMAIKMIERWYKN